MIDLDFNSVCKTKQNYTIICLVFKFAYRKNDESNFTY